MLDQACNGFSGIQNDDRYATRRATVYRQWLKNDCGCAAFSSPAPQLSASAPLPLIIGPWWWEAGGGRPGLSGLGKAVGLAGDNGQRLRVASRVRLAEDGHIPTHTTNNARWYREYLKYALEEAAQASQM